MSSYLLLRNNKETGPFTIEEIKGMSLKPYDLLWIVGKSAAWRYPGEINELKSFAPPVPEQIMDSYSKKPSADNSSVVSLNTKKADATNVRIRENHVQKSVQERAVYVNLPAEKKQETIQPDRVLFDLEFSTPLKHEPAYDFSDIYRKKPNPAIHLSAKILWISTIVLLFGAGLLTGFFISDRREFFSIDANHPQNSHVPEPSVLNNKKNISPIKTTTNSKSEKSNELSTGFNDRVKPADPLSKKQVSGPGKKNAKINVIKKDSVINQTATISSLKLNDSLKENAISKTEVLYQKIKAHPENYVNLVTGRYSTGVFGGISSFPVSVTNNSPVMMDQILIDIDYIQNNDKIFKTESLSFDNLEPGETVTIKAPRSPRGIKIATRIHLVNSRQLDLSPSN
jgi:hypothetical protein